MLELYKKNVKLHLEKGPKLGPLCVLRPERKYQETTFPGIQLDVLIDHAQ